MTWCTQASRQPEYPDTVLKRDREQKEKIQKCADKRRHTAVMRIEVGDTILCKQEKKNSQMPLFNSVPMVVIGIKGNMITTENQKIWTRNYMYTETAAGSQLHVRVTTLMMRMPLTQTNFYQVQTSPMIAPTWDKDGWYATSPREKPRPQRTPLKFIQIDIGVVPNWHIFHYTCILMRGIC